MRNILLLTLCFAMSVSASAQYIKIPSGSLNFLQNNVTIVNFETDLATTTVNGFESIDDWVDFRYNEVLLAEDEGEAKEWKTSWNDAVRNGLEEFRKAFNDELGNAPISLRKNATAVKYTATLKIDEMVTGKGFGNSPATISGSLTLKGSNGEVLSVIEILNFNGIRGGGMPMRIKTCFRRTGANIGEKIYLGYFR